MSLHVLIQLRLLKCSSNAKLLKNKQTLWYTKNSLLQRFIKFVSKVFNLKMPLRDSQLKKTKSRSLFHCPPLGTFFLFLFLFFYFLFLADLYSLYFFLYYAIIFHIFLFFIEVTLSLWFFLLQTKILWLSMKHIFFNFSYF